MSKALHTACVQRPVDYHPSLFFLSFSLATLPTPSHGLQRPTWHECPKFVKIVEVGPRDGLQNEMVGSHASHPIASWL